MSTPAITPYNGTDATGGDSSTLSLVTPISVDNGDSVNGSDDGFEFMVYDGRCRLGIGVDGTCMDDDSWCRVLLFWSCEEEIGVIAYMAELDVCRRGLFSGIIHDPPLNSDLSTFDLLLSFPFIISRF